MNEDMLLLIFVIGGAITSFIIGWMVGYFKNKKEVQKDGTN